ncbi:hypothetical protein SO802_010825 [Lithocarpus litseifolius]|uniref:Reverse transcriptase n=1 Tax=Lithocarpus litseifolius TaxID=425828 RepID=A0AAW2DI95_9ROSI
MEVREGVIELVGEDLAGHEDGAENHLLRGVDKEGRVSCSVDLGVQNSSLDRGIDLAPAIHQEHMYCNEEGAWLSNNKTENTWTKLVPKVVEDDGFVWNLTGFYGWPEANEKRKSWALLSHLWSFSEGSWCCVGDFNAILHASKKQSVHAPYYNQMEDFRVALEECKLADLGFTGHKFIWKNRRPGSAHTKQRLEGATANRVWIEKLPASLVSHLFSHASDNLPILLKTMNDRRVKGRRAGDFKFIENWLLKADCDKAVTEAWINSGCGSSGLSGVRDQIQACGAELHAWGSSKTKPETKEIKRLQKKKKLEVMNESELTEDSRKEFLRVSK